MATKRLSQSTIPLQCKLIKRKEISHQRVLENIALYKKSRSFGLLSGEIAFLVDKLEAGLAWQESAVIGIVAGSDNGEDEELSVLVLKKEDLAKADVKERKEKKEKNEKKEKKEKKEVDAKKEKKSKKRKSSEEGVEKKRSKKEKS